MTGAIKPRLKNLEHAVELERAALMQELQDEVFEVMRIPDGNNRLLDAISERAEACTPEEEAAAGAILSRVRKSVCASQFAASGSRT